MSSNFGGTPKARVDDEPARAPGGADAVEAGPSDAGTQTVGVPVTPDAPVGAQQDEAEIPRELREPERPEPHEQETDNTDVPSS